MLSSPSPARRDGPRPAPFKERRRQADHSPLARLRSLIGRPFRLSWQGGPHWVWVERRRADAAEPDVAQLRADLRTEMLTVDDAALVLRELVQVDERLAQQGWPGLHSLPAATLLRARLQAEMLAESSGSAPLAGLAQRLRALEKSQAASLDGARPSEPAHKPCSGAPRLDEVSIEVSELAEADYNQAALDWANSQPPPTDTAPSPGPDLKA
jgi:hypothetical protein